ncbi:preprotein translocase subunit YajC [Oceanospirillum sediminis]|uniref:Sec translocon accessory complex subunit YajC n=1 Tax=Oceanospirillum sediminis TaxID=2760088 RepID=A0A839IK67_9GAMM|nr:preprotein translocase subunit YajC [Oceanospirillum sediminis]MBB1485575.1 preprotein translocase subunit YajC [Oceanospirillum sediminis]
MSFFISPAFAEGTAAAAGQPGAMSQIFLLVGFVVIFYFMLWRPQSKRAKEHRELVSGISKGDEIVIGGGLVGRVSKVGDEFVVMEIAEGTEVNVQKNSVVAVLPKGTIKSI